MCNINFHSQNPSKTDDDIRKEYEDLNPTIRGIIDGIASISAITITGGKTDVGHSKKGQHPKGNAVDFYFDGEYADRKSMRVAQIANLEWILTKYGADIGGIGVFNNSCGFHLDTRDGMAAWGYPSGSHRDLPEEFLPVVKRWRGW